MTKTEKAIKFLTEERGMVEISSKSQKYRTFLPVNSENLYFVGKRGAVRAGKCSSKSFSITDAVHAKIK